MPKFTGRTSGYGGGMKGEAATKNSKNTAEQFLAGKVGTRTPREKSREGFVRMKREGPNSKAGGIRN